MADGLGSVLCGNVEVNQYSYAISIFIAEPQKDDAVIWTVMTGNGDIYSCLFFPKD